ncbi:MAG: bacteriohemerythrin [Azonexus sp.]|jgi:hemerythrin|nr:bacteriohemerythrin [Azonexus sp.]
MPIDWTPDLDLGIEAIDRQHRRIISFINALELAQTGKDKSRVKKVIDDCVDYTLSHFAFEEELQKDVGYPYCKIHKKVHGLFAAKIAEYQQRVTHGEDIGSQLHDTLVHWLIHHIKNEDVGYVSFVKASEKSAERSGEDKKHWLRRLFS